MIRVRLIHGVKRHFPARKAEWACAIMALGIGVQFLQPGSTFAISHVYDGMAAIAPEWAWGAWCFTIGSTRLAALIINGTFAESWYGRWSPITRMALSYLSGLAWGFLWVGIISSGVNGSLGIVIFPAILFLDIANAVQAAHDAREQFMRARNAGA